MVLETDKNSLTEKEKLMNITLDATQQKELKKKFRFVIKNVKGKNKFHRQFNLLTIT